MTWRPANSWSMTDGPGRTRSTRSARHVHLALDELSRRDIDLEGRGRLEPLDVSDRHDMTARRLGRDADPWIRVIASTHIGLGRAPWR